MSKMNNVRVPGMSCPQCSSFIPTSVHELLSAGELMCPLCGLRLHINRESSLRAMELLEKVNLAQQRVQESQTFNR
jgi:transcription elongation factor Elf1